MSQENQLSVVPQQQGQIVSFQDLRVMAEDVHKSGMLGTKNVEQAIVIMGICQAEGIHPLMVTRRYHIIEGHASMRADAMTGEYLSKGGTLLWHVRTDSTCAATFFANGVKVTEEAINRGRARCRAILKNDIEALIDLSLPGEETIVRTLKDCEEKGLTTSWRDGKWETKKNWQQSPRQMLTARVETEGIRLMSPGLIAGIYDPDEVEQIIDNERALPEATGDERIIQEEAKRLEANGVDPDLAKRFEPKEHRTPEPARTQEQPKAPEQPKEAPKAAAQPHPSQEKVAQGRVVESEAPVQSAPSAATGRKPLTEMSAEELPEGQKWRAHTIGCISSPGYPGKRLDSFPLEQLAMMQHKWVEAFAEKIAKSEVKKTEARAVTEAFTMRTAQAAGDFPSDEDILASIYDSKTATHQ